MEGVLCCFLTSNHAQVFHLVLLLKFIFLMYFSMGIAVLQLRISSVRSLTEITSISRSEKRPLNTWTAARWVISFHFWKLPPTKLSFEIWFLNISDAVYSRITRVYKSDRGGPHKFRYRWTSFLKSRLDCSVSGDYPFFLNEIRKFIPFSQQRMDKKTYSFFSLILILF